MTNPNFDALKRACERLGVPFAARHASPNLAEVTIHGKPFVFVAQTPPLNDHAQGQLCRDKDFFQSLAGSAIRMPRREAYLDPHCTSRFQSLAEYPSVAAIAERIAAHFQFPCILKRNRGAAGSNVFKCDSPGEVTRALERIFNQSSKYYDYVALCQDFIRARTEYRCVFLDSKLELCYRKEKAGAEFVGNLSPLHFDGAYAALETNIHVQNDISDFCANLFARVPLRYCGLDIVRDAEEKLWLLEANGSPGFQYFVRDCGLEPIVTLYEKILKALVGRDFDPVHRHATGA